MTFQNPEWFFLLLGPPLAWLFRAARRRGRVCAVRHPTAGLMRARLRWASLLPDALAAAAFALFVAAMARPEATWAVEDTGAYGVDILLALDASGTMGAMDFPPKDRLEAAKRVVAAFAQARPSDRMGLVVFAAGAVTRCPLTTDHEALLQATEAVALGELPDGTAIGSAVATALNRLRVGGARSRVLILVTDGVNNSGEIDPLTAADMAKALGVKIYAVGVGREGAAPVPVVDPGTGERRVVELPVRIDEETLAEMARRTGGAYYRATGPDALRQVFERVDALEKSPVRVRRWAGSAPLFAPWVAWGAVLLAAGVLWGEAGWRVMP